MNELIKELAHKADFINKKRNGAEWRWGYIDPELSAKLEKFTNLIIQECLDILADESDKAPNANAWQCKDGKHIWWKVKHHFEVKD